MSHNWCFERETSLKNWLYLVNRYLPEHFALDRYSLNTLGRHQLCQPLTHLLRCGGVMAGKISKTLVIQHLIKKLGGRTLPCLFLWVSLIESDKEFIEQLRERMVRMSRPGILKNIRMVITLNLEPIGALKLFRNLKVSQPSGKRWKLTV
jgi:hypothetical protein